MFFSVIVPCYNVAKFVEKTLDTICNQTYKNFEVLAINDGSTDNTLEVLNNFSEKFPIRVLNQENKGLGGARNRGIRESNAEYVAFLDADDFWEPQKLERVASTLTDVQADLVCHDESIIRNGKVVKISHYGPYNNYRDLLLNENCLSPSAVIVKKDALFNVGLFSEDRSGHGVEDYDMWLKLLKKDYKFFYLHETLGSYVMHDNNMSDEDDFARREEAVVKKHFSETSIELIPENLRKKRFSSLCIREAWRFQKRKRYLLALKKYRNSLQYKLFNFELIKYMFAGQLFLFYKMLLKQEVS